jgi:hypothetical protein
MLSALAGSVVPLVGRSSRAGQRSGGGHNERQHAGHLILHQKD